MASLGQLAEEYVFTDPNSAMVKIRQFGETMTQIILATEKIPDPKELTQNDRLYVLKSEGILPSDILPFFHLINDIGIWAVHGFI